VDTNIILDRMSNLDLKVENILKEQYARDIKSGEILQEPIAVATSIKFAIKSIFLIVVTMAAFMFFWILILEVWHHMLYFWFLLYGGGS